MRLGWITGLILIVPALAWIAFEMGLWPGTADKYAQCKNSAVAGGDDLGGPFELVNTKGKTVTDKDVITEPSLVYFGYTYCPDVCPLDVSRNAAAVDILAERGVSATPIFISICQLYAPQDDRAHRFAGASQSDQRRLPNLLQGA